MIPYDFTLEFLLMIHKYESISKELKNKFQSVFIEMLGVIRKLKVQQVRESNFSEQSLYMLEIYIQ